MLREKSRSDPPLIEVRSVSFSYGKNNTGRALNRVSFFVTRGERVAILGHNGSGKSTLSKIIGGIIDPSEGSCFISGKNIQEMEFRELRGKIGMLFQDPENQIVAAMLEDDVAFAPENQGLDPDEIQLRVDMALAQTDMLKKKDSAVSALSGGEKQRAALAGVLAANVECLILDEPTAMLDPSGRRKIEKVLRLLHSDGMTIIQITHQLEAESFSDIQKVIVLSEGSVKWQGTTNEFWDNAEILGFTVPDSLKIERLCYSKGIIFPEGLAGIIHRQQKEESAKESENDKFLVDGLSFRYDEKSYALRDIHADIHAGEWLSIIGRSGSGKSTLVQHLNALYKIQEGKIFFDGLPLPQKGEEVHTLRQRTGLVFQNPEDQLFSVTVKEELEFAPKNAGFKGEALNQAVIFGLECTGLSRDFLTRSPLALSGGERRLVAIASVLSAKPEVIVLDEPLAGLDASYQRKILGMLTKLRDEGRTVVTVTHDLDMALHYSDRILLLRDSRVINEGRPDEIIRDIMNATKPEAWPEVLRISDEIRKVNPDFPLIYDYEEFAKCLQ